MVLSTDTTDTSSTGHATTVLTKLGMLIKPDTHIQDNHWLMELDSKSSQECLDTEHSSGTNILVEVNSDLESETITAKTIDNGSSSIEDPELLELGAEEATQSLTREDMASELESLLLSDNSRMRFTKELSSTEDLEETLETLPLNVSTSTEEETLT